MSEIFSPETASSESPVAVKESPAVVKTPGWWRVRVSHPKSNKRTVFRSINERRARQWLMNRAPRGEEFYLESPTGEIESYVHGRMNDDGTDASFWQPFDPSQFVPPEEMAAPGDAGWPDMEG